MNTLVSYASIACFVGLPPVLLGVRLFRGRPAWWIIFAVLILAGWASWLGAVTFHFEALGDQIASLEDPPPELLEAWASDGGPKVFALLFGWAIAAAYTAAWYVVFLLLLILRRIFGYRCKADRLELRIVNRADFGTSDDAR